MTVTPLGGGRVVPSRRRAVTTNIVQALRTLLRPPRWPVPSKLHALYLVAGLALIVLVIAGAMLEVDGPAIQLARQLPRPAIDVFERITDFGQSGWFLIPLGILLTALTALSTPALSPIAQNVCAALAVRLGFLFLAIGVPGLFATVIKRLIGRARPYVGGADDPFRYMSFAWQSDYASFPSGHTTTAFAALVAFGALWPRLRPLMWTYALLIAVSRVAVTAHHPSDVMAGAVVGAVGAWLVRDWFAARRLAFAVDAEGRIHPMAGPSWRRIRDLARRLVGSNV